MDVVILVFVALIWVFLLVILKEFRRHTHYLPKIQLQNLHRFQLPPQREHIETEKGWSYHKELNELRELYNKLVEERDAYKQAFEDQLKQFNEYAKSKGVTD